MAQYPFKAEEVKTFEPLQAGSYKCEIIKTDVMKTKDEHGRYVFLQFRIKDGNYKGRQIFQRLNTLNRSTQAMKIGKELLSKLCYSIGLESFNDTDEMLNYETIVNLGEGNKLYGFSRVDDNLHLIQNEPNEEMPPIIDVAEFEDDKIPF